MSAWWPGLRSACGLCSVCKHLMCVLLHFALLPCISCSGMTGEMVDTLASKFSIYMTRNGRISMAGVNTKNVGRLAEAIHAVTK